MPYTLLVLFNFFVLGFNVQAVDYESLISNSFEDDIKLSCSEDIRESIFFAQERGEEASKVRFDENHENVAILSGSVSLYFLDLLDRLPTHIDTIALELPAGGHALASILIADKVRSLGLNTYVGLSWCHSACTVIFQGGVERVVDPKAVFTYHGVSRGESLEAKNCSALIQEKVKSKYVELGFPPDLLTMIKNPATVSPMFSKNLLESGIATLVDRQIIGKDAEIIERNAKPDYCDRNPDDEEC